MFCVCGTIIIPPKLSSEKVACRRCNHTFDQISFQPITITKTYRLDTVEKPVSVRSARIKESCPKCNHNELLANSTQLRSADEGQTVFYTCEKCGYKETVQS